MNNHSGQLSQIFLFGCIAVLFYFFLIRPQNKLRKQMEDRLSKLKVGDEVIIASGLFAIIDRLEDKNVYLKLGNNIVKARRNSIISMADEQISECTSECK